VYNEYTSFDNILYIIRHMLLKHVKEETPCLMFKTF